MDASPFIVTVRNATLEGRSFVETLILAASSFDFAIAGRVGFGIEELKTISGATREEILATCERMLNKGELDNTGFLYYGTSRGADAFDAISAFPE